MTDLRFEDHALLFEEVGQCARRGRRDCHRCRCRCADLRRGDATGRRRGCRGRRTRLAEELRYGQGRVGGGRGQGGGRREGRGLRHRGWPGLRRQRQHGLGRGDGAGEDENADGSRGHTCCRSPPASGDLVHRRRSFHWRGSSCPWSGADCIQGEARVTRAGTHLEPSSDRPVTEPRPSRGRLRPNCPLAGGCTACSRAACDLRAYTLFT